MRYLGSGRQQIRVVRSFTLQLPAEFFVDLSQALDFRVGLVQILDLTPLPVQLRLG